MIEVVQTFIGEAKRARRARTTNGVVKLLKNAAWGDGWGAMLRGTKANLIKVGALETQAGGWIFTWYEGRNKREMYVDCDVS